MRFDFYGLGFHSPRVTFYLWSPWRAAAPEHRLVEGVRKLPHVEFEEAPDEWRVHVTDQKTWRAALQMVARVMKGWQEDADPGSERRTWRWLIEGDTDADGYDHSGEQAALWAIVRVSLERGGPGEGDKSEDVDLEGFSLRVWGEADRPGS